MITAKVLVLDDEIFIANDIRDILEDEGYDVIKTSRAKDAIDTMNNTNSPDLALLDIELQYDDINGIEVARQILKKKSIPIIFLTAHSEKYYEEAKKVGPANFFDKGATDLSVQLPKSIDLAIRNYLAEEDGRAPNFVNAVKGKISINAREKWDGHESEFRKIILDKSDILFVKEDSGTIDIYTKNRNKPYNISMGIGWFTEQLNMTQHKDEENDFIRTKRGELANLQNIIAYDSGNIYFDSSNNITASINRETYLLLKEKFFPPFRTKPE